MNLENRLLRLLARKQYVPAGADEITKKLGSFFFAVLEFEQGFEVLVELVTFAEQAAATVRQQVNSAKMFFKLRQLFAGPFPAGQSFPCRLQGHFQDAFSHQLGKQHGFAGQAVSQEKQHLCIGEGTLRVAGGQPGNCLLYTSPSPRDGLLSRMPSSA